MVVKIKKEKVKVKEKLVEFFREKHRGMLRDIVTYIYGDYDKSKASIVLKYLRGVSQGQPIKLDKLIIYKLGRGDYASSDYIELINKIGSALLEFNKEGKMIVSPESIRVKAGIPKDIPPTIIGKIAEEIRKRLGLMKPSIGAITI